MKKKILCTGVAGMMGSHSANYLIKNYGKEFDIYGIDDLSGGYKENINKKCIFTKLDLSNFKKLSKYFDKNFKTSGIDYIIHYAASAEEIRSYFTPVRNSNSNDVAARNLLTCAINYNLKHFVFFTSMSRYGNGELIDGNGNLVEKYEVPFKEEFLPCPADPYAVSKVATENLIKAFNKVYDFTYTIFCPHNCLSPFQYITPYRNFLAIFFNLILMKKDCYIYGDGEQKRAISWVDDFNPVTCESLFNKDTYGQVINIGGDDYRSINEWYQLVQEVTGYSKPAIYVDKRPGEVKFAYCNHDKAYRLTGFENKTPVKDALTEMWEYFKKRGPRKFKYVDSFEINSDKIPITWKKHLF